MRKGMNIIFDSLWEYLKSSLLPGNVNSLEKLWLTALLHVGWVLIEILCQFILAKLAIRIVLHIIHRLFNSPAVRMDERRKKTLESLLDNVSRYLIYFIFALMALQTIGVNISALLAGASIAGVAIGFGAQSLIKDILTGFFILFEDQYGVGDVVKINNFTGTVETIGLRLTRIKAWTGEVEIIPNGQITQVTNYSRHNSLAVIDVAISYRTDTEKAQHVMQRVMDELKDTDENVIDAKVLGVQSLRDRDVVMRAIAECKPNTQAAIQRVAQQRIKEAFEREGIEFPIMQAVMFNHHDEPGKSS
jgi:moderate conductance mechanosensitive channel